MIDINEDKLTIYQQTSERFRESDPFWDFDFTTLTWKGYSLGLWLENEEDAEHTQETFCSCRVGSKTITASKTNYDIYLHLIIDGKYKEIELGFEPEPKVCAIDHEKFLMIGEG